MTETKYLPQDYRHEELFPTFYCPGCGAGILFQALTRALAAKNIDPHKTVFVCGIGCWGNIDRYVRANALHGTHGRTLAFATGVKLANPELTVIGIVGDGDGITIGGNHFIQACRRNIDITCVMLNNQNYGMTGGQVSAATPHNAITSTTKYGNPERSFDISGVAMASGANYTARTTVYHVEMLERLLEEGISHPGFSSIEVLSPCVAGFDRYNKRGDIPDMYRYLKEHAVPYRLGSENRPLKEDEFYIGCLGKREEPDYRRAYEEMRARALGNR